MRFRRLRDGIVAACGVLACSGDPSGPQKSTPPPTTLPKVVAVSISTGSHNCAIRDDTEAICWGTGNGFGELGTGGSVQSADPRNVSGGLKFTSIVAGYVHTCAVTAARAGYCWGFNRESDRTRGMVGDGTDVHRFAPTAVAGGHAFTVVEAGGHHSCGITTAGETYCWGTDANAELGTGETFTETGRPARLTPVKVAGGIVFVSLSLGYQNSCGLTAAGKAYCWGASAAGQSGTGTTFSTLIEPRAVAGDIAFQSISTSIFAGHTCGLAVDLTAYCWGSKRDFPSAPTPVAVSGMRFVALTAGSAHACGLDTDGKAHCWGRNNVGQLGDGTFTNRATPAPVLDGLAFKAIDAGIERTCALTAAGIVYCWGDNDTRPVKPEWF